MYPRLTPADRTRTVLTAFAGYDHNPLPAENAFYDMENLSSDLLPVLSPRKKRGTYASPAALGGIIAKDTLCYVDGSKLVVNGYEVEMGLSPCAEGETKTLVSMGAYIVIFPDKKYINSCDLTDLGSLDAEFSSENENEVTFRPVNEAGEDMGEVPASAAAPADPAAGEYWIDTSSSPHLLKMWSDSMASWVTVESTAVRMEATGLGAAFRAGDGVKISGIVFDPSLNGYAVIKDAGEDYIVVPGLIEEVAEEAGTLLIERHMPYFDFITEAGNRLWACRYGTSREGEVVNEIYASKLGDFKNWNCFEGLSTDSYAASVGTDGAWTGAATHLGYPCFFKENVLHKVYAAANGAHRIQETPLFGVKRGCERSLATVGQTLFYLSPSGVMAYDGSLPVSVSAPLGRGAFEEAAAGVLGDKYVLSAKDGKGAWHLFLFDTSRSLWHREDATHAEGFAASRGELYFMENGVIRTVNGSGEEDEEPVKWSAETGPIGILTPDHLTLCRLNLSMELARGSKCRVEIAYDNETRWEEAASLYAAERRTFTLPILPRRASFLRLRLSGEGDFKLFSLARVLETGCDR